MALLIVYVLLALLVSFACSVMEAVLLSMTPAYVAAYEEKHPSVGKRIRRLKSDIDRPLAAILSLNTIAHTVGAAGAGAQAAKVYGEVYLGVISGILTFLILIFSEIIPKSLGARYWRELTPLVVWLLQPLIVLLWPLVALAKLLGSLFSGNRAEPVFHPAELAALGDLGWREGALGDSELRILKSLLRFRDLRVVDIMTPRTVLQALPQTLTVEASLEKVNAIRFSRIPVYGEDLDDIKGYVLKDDILFQANSGHGARPITGITRSLPFVPAITTVPQLFEKFLGDRQHLALVVNEWGGTDGVVTMEDVIETILGLEIVDEGDIARDMQELARERWRKRARALGMDAPD